MRDSTSLTPELLAALDTDPLQRHESALAASADGDPVRRAYAATRLVMQAEYAGVGHSLLSPGSPQEIHGHIDWEATLAARRRIDSFGIGIAEAMDTCQRFQVGWPTSRRLIEGTARLAPRCGFVAGAGADHLEEIRTLEDLIEGVSFQANWILELGGVPVLLPLPWLTENGVNEDGYCRVYSEIIDRVDGDLIIHWLGPMFLPGLENYFPGNSFMRIMDHDPEKVRGAKLSLFDIEFERTLRTTLAERGQAVFTGDDLSFSELIAGDDQTPGRVSNLDSRPLPCGQFSHALLGILDAIPRPASLALRALKEGDVDRYREIMEPCTVLSQHVFSAPTHLYRVGLAQIGWLNGLQDNPMLANHEEQQRDQEFLIRTAELAARAGAIDDGSRAKELLSGLT